MTRAEAARAPGGRRTARVLYIAGTGRSGSTLLANVLGSVDGLVATGEMRFVWQRGLLEQRRCGCREPVRSCPFWQEVLADAYGGADAIDPTQVQRALAPRIRMRRLPHLLLTGRELPIPVAEQLGALYRSILTVSGCDVIVDSSKLPTYALLLSAVPGIDLRILHLVRDPRAAAWSWMRGAASAGVAGFDEEMDRFSPVKSSVLWDVWNATTRLTWRAPRYLRVRYEDLMATPATTVRRILDFVGMRDRVAPLAADGTIDLAVNHQVAGNPNRMRHGATRLRQDRRWEDDMPVLHRSIVTALTAPLLPAMGYRIRG